MIQQTLLPLVFLATVVVSTSNILPNSQQSYYPLQDQVHYRQRSYTYPPSSLNKLYNIQENREIPDSSFLPSFKPYHEIDKSHRNQQWHNYPRQLDRLEKYYDRHKSDAMDKSQEEINHLYKILQSRIDTQKPTVTDVMMNDPGSIEQKLKLNTDFGVDNFQRNVPDSIRNTGAYQDLKRDSEFLEIPSSEPQPLEPGIQLNKRILSLLSRVRAMTPRKYELHHRRYLHSFYGIPEDMANELTAETRAGLRPLGSPLRWG